jgi:DNA polymerase-3 subunit gamma/tau
MHEPATYLPLTRKYRPTALSQIRAQEMFAEILARSISTDQLAHAYMLTGMRGIGKTSLARVIARTISCTNKILHGTISPCEKCANCSQYLQGSHPDIIEMDAASHTGIDDVRNIIDGADYKPLLGQYKIYIIDEVHMLSKGAFNALLKIIEEPPIHLIFIFATTEVQKVPATIISRCQRFNLKRFTIRQLTELLQEVCTKENIPFEENALNTIALKSEGSARDALSILEQAKMAVENNAKITSSIVCKLTGTTDIDKVVKIIGDIFTNHVQEALDEIHAIHSSSVDLSSLLEEMLTVICLCCKLKMIHHCSLDHYYPYKDALTNIINTTSLVKLTLIWQLALNCIKELKDFSQHLQTAEMMVMKMLCIIRMPDATEGAMIQNQPSNDTIFALLEHLYNNRWFEVYYYLMNEVEILSYDKTMLHISEEGSKEALNSKLIEALKIVVPSLKISTRPIGRDPLSLKQSLIDKLKTTSKWEVLKKYFNAQEISDIIFCKDSDTST